MSSCAQVYISKTTSNKALLSRGNNDLKFFLIRSDFQYRSLITWRESILARSDHAGFMSSCAVAKKSYYWVLTLSAVEAIFYTGLSIIAWRRSRLVIIIVIMLIFYGQASLALTWNTRLPDSQGYSFHSGKLSVDWNGKKSFLCLVSSGLELMTLTQRTIFLSVPIHG
jgi:hypothetical protein